MVLGALIIQLRMGFSDRQIGVLWKKSAHDIFDIRKKNGIMPVYKMIDTCASEFESYVPYFYSTYEGENESQITDKKKIIVLGSGEGSSYTVVQLIKYSFYLLNGINAIRIWLKLSQKEPVLEESK